MTPNILTPLNVKVNLAELRSYYDIVNTKFQHLNWSWSGNGDDVIPFWRELAYADKANLLTHGWAIQSNLKDLSIPCPPWNISTLEIVPYRNTPLAFGIVEKLQDLIPYAYRWGISVQEPCGTVSLHSDDPDDLTVWLPVHTTADSPCITFVEDGKEIPMCLEADGRLYLFDTTVPHYTFNYTTETRVSLIFRIHKKYRTNILALQ